MIVARVWWIFSIVIVIALCSSTSGSPAVVKGMIMGVQSEMTEWTFETHKAYADPFNDIDIDAVFAMGDRTWRVPGFWRGGNKWGIRFAAPLPGSYRFHIECTDKTNPDLNGHEGEFVASAYSGDNPLLKHGPLRASANGRYFEHEDGTPFLWLGDTWWKGLCGRITWEGFQKLTADRKAKGFNVVQIVAGPYPDEPPFDPRWENEGGMAYEKGYEHINPAYFDYADRRIKLLVDSGIVPAIVGGWVRFMPDAAKMKKHWRYLIARYGAYPTVWIIAGEAWDPVKIEGDPKYYSHGPMTEVTRYARSIDPYHRMITMHPPGSSSGRQAVSDESLVDFDMLQTMHHDWQAVPTNLALVSSHRSKTPAMPVLIGEANYEGHMGANRQDLQRFDFWTTMMIGAAGFSYGAGGIWQMNSDTVRGSAYEFTPWEEAMVLPGSTQLGLAKKILERYPWWEFEPHPEWVEPHGTEFMEPHAEWYDARGRWATENGRYDLPYAAGIPGRVMVVYLPGYHFYDWSGPTLPGVDRTHHYRGSYINPITGVAVQTWTVFFPTATKLFEDKFDNQSSSAWVDCGSPSHISGGKLTGSKNMVTLLKDRVFDDVMVSVGANTESESGIVLRYQDPENYLAAIYSPSLKAVYIQNRVHGDYGPQLGYVRVPEIGSHIRLTAQVSGSRATVAISDGARSYCTSTVQVENVTPGPIGLWHFQIGETQSFDDFVVSAGIKGVGADPNSQVSLTDPYAAPPIPAPQDWVLIMEDIG